MATYRVTLFETMWMEEVADAVRRAGYVKWNLAGDLDYAAHQIRQAAKKHQADDPAETDAQRGNMRDCATRLARLARMLPVIARVDHG